MADAAPSQVLLVKAARPGRIRGIAVDLLGQVDDAPERAGGILRRGLREARALHSRERRLVSDGLRGAIRQRRWLDRALGEVDPEAAWLGWLVMSGLEVAVAEAERSLPFAAVHDMDRGLAGLDHVEQVSVRASVSREVAEELVRAFGNSVFDFVDASNTRAPVVLRVNTKKTSRERLLSRLAQAGVPAHSGRCHTAVIVETRAPLTGLRAFKQGWFELQDEGSQQVVEVVPAGAVVVDFCSGAGGKTLALGVRRPRRLVAVDVRQRALDELRRRAKRAGISVETVLWVEGCLTGVEADVVLADVPCTGTGALRRHPEYRLRLDAARLDELEALQRQIVDRALAVVRTGGALVYATCSVLPRENEDVVAWLLGRHPGLRLEEELRLAPHTTNTDGFYAAVFKQG